MHEILVVDDDAAVRKMLAVLLERAGYLVATAADGQDAVNTVGRTCFDLVITDIVMPGGDGHSLARHVAERCPGARVLMVSGYDPGCDSCPFVGDCPLVPKPVTIPALLKAVTEILQAPPRARKPNGNADASHD